MRGFFVQVGNSGGEFSTFDDFFLAKNAEIGKVCRNKFLGYVGILHHLIVPMPGK